MTDGMEVLDVLIVGAGVSGIGMACTLTMECPGKRYAILERRQRLGGTWDLFNYPGVRSDSDMFTYGYRFRPWNDTQVMADGTSIRNYLGDTARQFGVDQHIRYGLKITTADWASEQQCWAVTALDEASGETLTFKGRQLVLGTGYYNYDKGHTPEFPGIEDFKGQVVHPQHWPEKLDFAAKRVVVVGSGATAMTLVPAMAMDAAHITLLQRSPTYILAAPGRDKLTEHLSRIVPKRWAFALARKRNTAIARWIYVASRRWPEKVRGFLLKQTAKHLNGSADMAHFTPRYMPWDQRMCVVPDGDLFKAIRSGRASVVTDHIAGFDGHKIELRSGQSLEADILIAATGLEMQAFGGMQVSVDGEPYLPQRHMFYKGVLMEGAPNFAWIVGYTNMSWTLKADLASSYLCRLYKHMDAKHQSVFRPQDRANAQLDESIMGNLNSGYVVRAGSLLPRQGREAPWRITHHYPSDKQMLLKDAIDDGVLVFDVSPAERLRA